MSASGRGRRLRLAGLARAACTLALAVGTNASLAGAAPLEYLDEVTGATVTVVGRPLVFVRGPADFVARAREYVTLAAASVDQSGKVSYVFIGYFWSAGLAQPADDTSPVPTPIVLQLQDRRIVLTPDSRPARDAGIGLAVHRPPFGHPAPRVYPVDLATLRAIAGSAHPVLYDGTDDTSKKYELFQDRLDALRDFLRRISDSD